MSYKSSNPASSYRPFMVEIRAAVVALVFPQMTSLAVEGKGIL